MADVNTGTNSEGKFIFGQNMEERVLKPPDSTEPEQGDTETDTQNNGVTSSSEVGKSDDGGQMLAPSGGDKPLLRPSAFASPAHGQAVGSTVTNNPFAARVAQASYSDSDDEKREKPIVAPAHFTPGGTFGGRGFGFGVRPSQASNRMLLRPSALDRQTVNFNKENSGSADFKTSFKLEPAKLQNPFLKTDSEEPGSPEKPKEEALASESKPEEPGTAPGEVEERLLGNDDDDENNVSSSTCNSPPKSNFVPLGVSQKSSDGFIFGQNMQHRVTGAADEEAENSNNFLFGQNLENRVSSPPNTVTPQSTASEDAGNTDNTGTSTEDGKPTSLVESAAAYEARLARPEFEEVEVRTGEEDESNVFQINVKLFLFDKDNQTWIEKGRGQLRLNDQCFYNSRAFQSRLVMRTQGSLRVVLNTKVWSGMLVEMASEKTVRITAVDQDEGVKIYLIMASRSDATHIYSAINSRVQQLKAQEPDAGDSITTPSCDSQTNSIDLVSSSQPEKRPVETSPEDRTTKRPRVARHKVLDMAKGSDHPRDLTEESNDSSTVDPETEASNESCTSSPNVKSSSSE